MNENVLNFYQQKLDYFENIVKKYNGYDKYTAVSRFIIFMSIPVLFAVWFFTRYFSPFFLVIPVVIFIVLTIINQKFRDILNYNISLLKLIKSEINFAEKKDNSFRCGSEFIDVKHSFSYDLDIFEEGSIFHSINRCSTYEGEVWLKDLLLTTKRDKSEILNNQEAVKELTLLRDLSHELSATGFEKPESLKSFIENISDNVKCISKKTVIFSYISSAVTCTAFILYLFNVFSYLIPFGLFIYQFAFSIFYSNNAGKAYSKTYKSNKSAKLYFEISNILKNREFKSVKLKNICENIKDMNIELIKLQKINNEFMQRNNGFVYLLSNGFLLRDIVLSYKLYNWIENNSNKTNIWISAVSELDALNSLSTFAFNNPELTYPIINDNVIIKAENIAHPVLNAEKRVGNNILIDSKKKFFIITGANMAGKSTFIRAVGINLILASAGAPVCANSFEFTPVTLFSSMRTSDKLMDSSSYFHAELARLKQLKDVAEKENIMFVLLDEILKGTNSIDKLQGSKLVLLKFISLNISGILATHDTALGELQTQYPDNFENYYFDFSVDASGEMYFDYKLKKGISNNMNAAILIKNVLEN